jgi:hypothetical protein
VTSEDLDIGLELNISSKVGLGISGPANIIKKIVNKFVVVYLHTLMFLEELITNWWCLLCVVSG